MRRILAIGLVLLVSLGVAAQERQGLFVPREKVGGPMLFCSRIISVNRAQGKVFADGQRNPYPVLVQFVPDEDSAFLLLRELREEAPGRGRGEGRRRGSGRRGGFGPVRFPVLEETPDGFLIDVSSYFSTYPEAVSAIPPKVLQGPAVAHEIIGVATNDRYLQVTGRYAYQSGLETTAACYLIFLKEELMPVRTVDPEKAGYNGVDFRTADGQRSKRSHRWAIEPGTVIDFYVDRSMPAEWYSYIKEGIEDWNLAFRAIGLGDVLAVHPEPEDGSFDRNAPLVNMVRFMDVDESNAKGDVLVDPRSGEILQADILWWKGVVDLICGWRYVQTGAADPAARSRSYSVEMLGPMIRHAICHEMGHALGLSHNMGASYAYPSDSLLSPSFTRQYGTAASVMDYARYNHLATAEDVAAGVNLLPPRVGPYDYYAIACGYGPEDAAVPGPYCYFAPFISAAISPDPSSQPETLGNDLIRSSQAGIRNCRALLQLDGLDSLRLDLIRRHYYQYIFLALSNIGGTVCEEYVGRRTSDRTLAFVMEALATVPPAIADEKQKRRILDELTGNFLPERVQKNGGEKELRHYYRKLKRLTNKYPNLFIS